MTACSARRSARELYSLRRTRTSANSCSGWAKRRTGLFSYAFAGLSPDAKADVVADVFARIVTSLDQLSAWFRPVPSASGPADPTQKKTAVPARRHGGFFSAISVADVRPTPDVRPRRRRLALGYRLEREPGGVLGQVRSGRSRRPRPSPTGSPRPACWRSACKTRFKGRAPKTGSKPRSAQPVLGRVGEHEGEVWFFSATRSIRRNWISTISRIWSRPSGRNMTISSIRLRNSGRSRLLSKFISSARRRSSACSVSSPSRASIRCWIISLPRLLVMMTMVLVKSATRPLLSVRTSVVEHLEEGVEDLRVGLLDLIQQDDRVRTSAHLLGELPALLVADVARRRPDEAADGVALLVLAHVDADHRGLVVEEELGQRLRQLGFSDAGRAEEDERADGSARLLQPGPPAPHGVGDRLDGLLLPRRRASSARPRSGAASSARSPASGSPECRSTG